MIPTLVITLREGLEASLIVGIVAAFLVREGRGESLKYMWLGVGIAVVACSAIAIGLRVADDQLPQRQQEGLETVVGLIAVGMITYMIIWMRRHSRDLKGQLEGSAAQAIALGSTAALVIMAALAVLREGIETAVFLLAAFQDSVDTTAAGIGAVIGLVAAIALGYAIYKGGIRINLSRFFRITGFVLVLVAAGLLSTAVHTAHEAGWFNSLQSQAVDLTWLVKPGTISGSLLTGMLGLQPAPTVGEALVYLLYAIPMGLYVVWPQRPKPGAPSRSSDERETRPSAVPAAQAGLTTMRRRALGGLSVGILAVGALGVAGCGEDEAPAGAEQLDFALTDDGCDPVDAEVPAGPVTFNITNDGSASHTELEVLDGDNILGERENITEGLTSSFSLTLQEGEYTVRCAQSGDGGTLTVTAPKEGTDATPELTEASDTYQAYVEKNSAELVAATKPFVAAVVAGDLAKAKELYGPARIPYERIEPVAESFGDLDPRIDARINDVPANQFSGFHEIEQALWEKGSTAGMAPVAKQLLADVEELQQKSKGLQLEAAQVANGASALLDEVSASKITGEEERYSHIDLVDFQANVDGSQAAFEAVKPLLVEKDPELADEITKRFAAVNKALDPYRKGDSFVLYTELSDDDTKQLSQAVDALAEPLSQVAAQIVS